MSRYTGPRLRIVRRLGTDLPGLTRKIADRRPYPPGQHGQRRRRFSEYKKQLYEKQKLRFNYGVKESQMRNLFREAQNTKQPTGEQLLRLLEQRLDNIVFRLGLAPTIPAARQLVVHGHIEVDGRKTDRPSYRIQPGQEVAVREQSRDLDRVEDAIAAPTLRPPSYLDFDKEARAGRMTSLPKRGDVPIEVDETFVVEYYSRRL
ncbi:MAG: 30S ribosomal protein S4 [Bradymonadaceae bacterium]